MHEPGVMRHDSRARLIITVAVVLAHVGLLLLMRSGDSMRQLRAQFDAAPRVVVTLLPKPVELPRHQPVGNVRKEIPGRRAVRLPPLLHSGLPERSGVQLPSDASAPMPQQAAAPALSHAPRALRRDAGSLRDAVRSVPRSLSEQLNAQRSELQAGPSPAARLVESVSAASIPDCLRPDALRQVPVHVGGLFDVPLLAYAAAKGLCR